MNGRCLFCRAEIFEGLQICSHCAEIIEPNAEIIDAMRNKYPVEYEGVKYGCISALTIRTRVSHTCRMKSPYILQAELMSGRSHSVTIADPQKVKILKEYKK